MDDETRQMIDELRGTVDRAQADLAKFSRQPRFNTSADQTPGDGDLFYSVWRWVEDMEKYEPPYIANSRKRDEWLREFWRKESNLMGVLNGVVAVDKNRGWSLTGGRNQVIRFTDVFHAWEGAPGMAGWRAGVSSAALSFYTSDLGAVVEVGREGMGGPLRGLYHVDPTRCVLTGNGEKPLTYYPTRGKKQDWAYDDFMRVVSMPSTDENFHGLGLCAVSRAAELAKLMIAIYQHDLEQMGAKAPRGLLLLKGISQSQWEAAMQARDAAMAGDNYKYFDAVAVLASGAADLDAKLVALSQLPAGFDRRAFTDLLMFGYALVFGYDPIEFWPVQFGALGRGNETQIQHDKATGKGGLDFALGFQEQLQENLPDTLQYELDQRDQDADLVLANIQSAWGDVLTKIAPFITADEARLLLAEREVIPHEWTEIAFDAAQTASSLAAQAMPQPQPPAGSDQTTQGATEAQPGSGDPNPNDTESSDKNAARMVRSLLRTRGTALRQPDRSWLKRMRDQARERESVWRAAETFPDDPIVRYEWPAHRTLMLWQRGADVFHREVYPAAKIRAAESEGISPSEILYDDGEVVITADDITRAIDEAGRRVDPDMADALGNEPDTA